MTRSNRRFALPAVVPTLLAATLALSGCGSGATSASTSSSASATSSSGMSGMSGMSSTSTRSAATGKAHDKADVSFATAMIPHHAQAVAMADMALTRAYSPTVTSLAKQIKAEQGPEIRTMSGWLTGWGSPQPTPTGHHGVTMHGSMGAGTSEMMSPKDMAALGAATGATFDRMWLTMMTAHHRGAVRMAKTELGTGMSPPAKALAGSIVAGQTKEIGEMRALLRGGS